LREDQVLSAALRSADGRIRAEAGNHNQQWKGFTLDRSTVTHTRVPIIKNGSRWGAVEIRFAAEEDDWLHTLTNPFTLLAVYVFVAGFFGYMFFMRRTLKHLDPGAVVPKRVKRALDALSEGIILLDDNENVVLANTSIGKKMGIDDSVLLGKKLSAMGWVNPATADTGGMEFPWLESLQSGEDLADIRLRLKLGDNQRTFMVNSTALLGDDGAAQGALVSFDDVTELESKNMQLGDLVGELRESRNVVTAKNEELRELAERDPLTNLYNRRAFFERLDSEFSGLQTSGSDLCILMLDIDHFKSINDNYGHGAGDEVIQGLAEIMQSELRGNEVAGRYGGEEFCVLIPDADIAIGARVAERLRLRIEEQAAGRVPQLDRPVTTSIGVASAAGGAVDGRRLLDQADEALYASKENGRNRVTRWDEIQASEEIAEQ
jgi:diguanylate cyclase (GGDEF)-like protein